MALAERPGFPLAGPVGVTRTPAALAALQHAKATSTSKKKPLPAPGAILRWPCLAFAHMTAEKKEETKQKKTRAHLGLPSANGWLYDGPENEALHGACLPPKSFIRRTLPGVPKVSLGVLLSSGLSVVS